VMNSNASLLARLRRVKSLALHPYLGIYHLEGEFSGAPLHILVADDGFVLDYIRGLAFPNGCNQTKKGFVSAFRAMDLGRSNADMVIVGANHLLLPRYEGLGFKFAPRFVRLDLRIYDTPARMIDNLPASAREDLRRNARRMMAQGFEYEVTSDKDWFDLFYYDMYRPYAENLFGELARVHPYAMVKRDFERGIGVSIKRDGNPVAGAVSYFRDSTMVNWWKGMLHGDHSYTRVGASMALYYYRIELASMHGCKMADFGYSAPFLSDGALNYKLKWGMEVAKADNSRGVYAITAPGRTEQAMRFLRANRFFCLTDRGVELCDDF